MRTVWFAVASVFLGIPFAVLRGGFLPAMAVTVLGWGLLFLAVRRHTHEIPKVVLTVLLGGFLALAGPLTVQDATVRALGDEVACPVRGVVYVPPSSGGRGRSGYNRWSVDCPGVGPVTFDAASSAIDRYRSPSVRVIVDPAGVATPRPAALLISPWFVLIAALGWVLVAGAAWRASVFLRSRREADQPASRRST